MYTCPKRWRGIPRVSYGGTLASSLTLSVGMWDDDSRGRVGEGQN